MARHCPLLASCVLADRCGNRSGTTPAPSSETETAPCAFSRTAATRIGVVSGACRVPAAAAQERASRLLDQVGHRRGLGRHRQRPRVDAPRVEQVADEAVHVGGLLADDAEELARLGRVELGRLLQPRVGRALDGEQRSAQLVAHQAQELGPQPLDLVERR